MKTPGEVNNTQNIFCKIIKNSFQILGDITTAAILHLASMVPKKLQFSATDFNSYNTVKTGTFVDSLGGKRTESGQKMAVPTGSPGLGIQPNWDVLKDPIFTL